ncbi:hypothetical protein BLAT2472_120054 [Burkholderia latens]
MTAVAGESPHAEVTKVTFSNVCVRPSAARPIGEHAGRIISQKNGKRHAGRPFKGKCE